MKNINISTDDFKKIIDGNYLYIDKTLIIKDIIDGSDSICFSRPRRFGKTVMMSMLKYFFDIKEDSKKLFKGLNITKAGDKYLKEMNEYPVIFVTLKECKAKTYDEFINSYHEIIYELYDSFKYLLDCDKISIPDKEYFEDIYYKKDITNIGLALFKLTKMLKIYYDKQVIVLMDEYDAPIMESENNGFYKECIAFFQKVFSSTFKSNLNLYRAVITGVLRVSKESLFSDANNIKTYNITDLDYSNYFGFTEEEVIDLLKEYQIEDKYKDVKKWYDGYNFSGNTIYNPWSILNFLADSSHELKLYWVNTGRNTLLRKLIYDNNIYLNEFEDLLKNNEVNGVNLNLFVNLDDLNGSRDTLWTLFMLSGYLTPDEKKNNTLRIPNLEIKENLESICKDWFNKTITSNNSKNLLDYLYNHNLDGFKELFLDISTNTLSYYDLPTTKRKAENFYHGFCLGMLYTDNPYFKIKSNRESGLGRYDLVIYPKKNNECNYAYILEFKVCYDGDFDKTIKNAFKQIDKMQYASELKKDGYQVTKIVIAFKGKKLKMEIK